MSKAMGGSSKRRLLNSVFSTRLKMPKPLLRAGSFLCILVFFCLFLCCMAYGVLVSQKRHRLLTLRVLTAGPPEVHTILFSVMFVYGSYKNLARYPYTNKQLYQPLDRVSCLVFYFVQSEIRIPNSLAPGDETANYIQ